MGIIEKLQKKLEGGKFRLLNEKLYKNRGLTEKEALDYHKYYESQVKKWPCDPKKTIINKIKKCGQDNLKIADLGCGSCGIAENFKNVSSFDKYPINDKVVKCELREIPVEDKQFDVAVCCLSLMMTNIARVLRETNRILKVGGVFYMSEVASRVKNMKKFINSVEKLGFKVQDVDKTSTYFFILKFEKISDVSTENKLPVVALSAWTYKKR
ncbi:uncharacterized protein VICG_00237 [Vittaforma corneae ATCC 50505]|uniref:Ribosomal RNA-processing protein 8 n=1 Tax=Vittaforma corneae (strain ATCC 50505) TaxID=993615 RepID=L2GRG3_VITCO|nr:uncharacterized protein VICG_00237 [Vittaforma corneae ATCC 50505]ELA42922.1 hypothetical protein VICG_00237 [Vittaforma corneae ATCC 50505]